MLTIRGCVVILALVCCTSCGRNEPVPKLNPPPPVEIPPPQPPIELKEVRREVPSEPQVLEGSGVTMWAKGYEGELIAGRDGALYLPYEHATIEHVQMVLKDRGLYLGPVNGILDEPTMKSVYAFQEANYHLQRCGVPTPHTRQLLAQGSHTDVNAPKRNPPISAADLR